MTSSLARLTLALCASAALAGAPLLSLAQTTNKPPVQTNAASQNPDVAKSEKTAKAGPFHGKLAALDKTAKTITVGKRTFQITSQTRIKKAGKPALLEDGVVGEPVSGYVKPTPDGKLAATSVNFGPKIASENSAVQKPASQTENQPKQPQ